MFEQMSLYAAQHYGPKSWQYWNKQSRTNVRVIAASTSSISQTLIPAWSWCPATTPFCLHVHRKHKQYHNMEHRKLKMKGSKERSELCSKWTTSPPHTALWKSFTLRKVTVYCYVELMITICTTVQVDACILFWSFILLLLLLWLQLNSS